jgi:hypothetical protein
MANLIKEKVIRMDLQRKQILVGKEFVPMKNHFTASKSIQ